MKVLVILLLIIAAVILFALFGPAKPEAQPALQPAQSGGAQPTVVRTAPAPAATPQARPAPPPVGGLSPAAQATGVTTETVDVGGGGATFEAKRRMTGKIRQLPGGKNP